MSLHIIRGATTARKQNTKDSIVQAVHWPLKAHTTIAVSFVTVDIFRRVVGKCGAHVDYRRESTWP